MLLDLQSGESAFRSGVDEQWGKADVGPWGEQYANKLREAGVSVTLVRTVAIVHDFLVLDSQRDTLAANVIRVLAVDALHTAFHGRETAA